MGMARPVGLPQPHAMANLVCPPHPLVQAHAWALMLNLSQQSTLVEQGHEPVQVSMCLEQPPVEPAGFVILAIGIVVADLGASDLIAHHKHWDAERENGNSEEILHLPI